VGWLQATEIHPLLPLFISTSHTQSELQTTMADESSVKVLVRVRPMSKRELEDKHKDCLTVNDATGEVGFTTRNSACSSVVYKL
jgi:hypothetical protein